MTLASNMGGRQAGTTVGHTLVLVWIVSASLLTVAFIWRSMEIHGDGFWYMVAGDWILDHGHLPDRDHFSFTSDKTGWPLHMPACQVGIAWIMRHGGPYVVLAAATVFEAASLLLVWLPYGPAWIKPITWVFLMFAVVADVETLSARGQVVGDLAFAALLVCLWRLRGGRRVSPIVAMLLAGFWINFHPSALLSVAMPCLFVGALALEPKQRRPSLSPFLLFGLFSLIGMGLTPLSYLQLALDLRLLTSETTYRINLFRSPDFSNPWWLLLVVLFVAAISVRTRVPIERFRRSDVALLLVLLAATCISRRYLPVTTALTVAILGDLARYLSPPRLRLRRFGTIVAGVSLIQCGVAAFWLAQAKDPWRMSPVQAAQFVQDFKLPMHVMNPYWWGGYLLYKWRGLPPVFIDGRGELYMNGVLDDYLIVDNLLPGWRGVLKTYDINTVLWVRDGPLDKALSTDPEWRLLYRDRTAVVYVRRM